MDRKGFIGGSDVRRIMDGDWNKLWEEKTGVSEPEDLSRVLPVQLGSFTEQFNIAWFEQEYNCKTTGHQDQLFMNWNGCPLQGHIDGKILDDNSKDLLECKHTFDRNTFEQCLRTYMPQIQFYLWIGQADGCYLSIIFGNRRWECQYVSKDWDYINAMQVRIKEFWSCVADNRRPFEDERANVSIDNIKVDGMVRRDASSDNEFMYQVQDYIQQEGNAKLFESTKSNLKAMVGDNEREVYCDSLIIKRDKRGSLRFTVLNNEEN
tara:strand:- start:6851 stop:7642 length:792 start_codon:yes stop_codon:yes gene_type:complete